jgi:hypothetical protein
MRKILCDKQWVHGRMPWLIFGAKVQTFSKHNLQWDQNVWLNIDPTVAKSIVNNIIMI